MIEIREYILILRREINHRANLAHKPFETHPETASIESALIRTESRTAVFVPRIRWIRHAKSFGRRDGRLETRVLPG